jgi:hypothetical protein
VFTIPAFRFFSRSCFSTSVALAGKIAGNWHANTAFFSNEINDFTRVGFFGGQVIDRDLGTFPPVTYRRSTAHSGVTACNEGFSPRESLEPR